MGCTAVQTDLLVLVSLGQAMSMIRREELSAAIFAPGWVFETQDKTKFIDNQNRCCVCAADTPTHELL